MGAFQPETLTVAPTTRRVHCQSFDAESKQHIAPTMLPSQLLFVELIKPPRFLLGREALIYQGFPVQRFLKKMAEEGYEASKDPMPQPAIDAAGGLGPGAKKKRKQPDRQWLAH